MQAVGESYQSLMNNHTIRSTSTIPFYSSVTGEKIEPGSQLGNNYWRQNLESPVAFSPAVKALLEDHSLASTDKLFIEIGPHSALAGPLRQVFRSVKTAINPQYLATMIRDSNCTERLLKTAGQLYLLGIPLHFSAINPSGKVLTNLPTYPWHHKEQYWNESRLVRDWRTRKFLPHETLGSRILEGNDLEPTWRNLLRLDDAPWIRDHVIFKDIIFPGAGYVAMAGEAIRQLTGSSDYTVRRVVISTALVLHESTPTEMMTSLRRERLTDSLDSTWYEFTIMSYNGTSWMKHCVGQVRAGPIYANNDMKKPVLKDLPRSVSPARWYKALKRVGLSYGTTFAGMSKISAGVKDEIAIATIAKGEQLNDPLNGLHPVIMDMCLQLYSVAACKGLPRHVKRLCIPAYFDEIYVRPASSAIRVQASTSSTERGTISGDAIGVADGEVVFRIKGLRLPPLEDPEKDPDPHACHELEWRPDIDFIDYQLKDLIAPQEDVSGPYSLCERLTILCILEVANQIPSTSNSEHFEKYRCWIGSQVTRAERGDYRLIPKAQEFASLSSRTRKILIKATLEEILPTDAAPLGRAIIRIFESTKSIFEEETEPLDILLQDNLLAEVYNFGDRWDYKTFIQLVSHHKPNLHVLEIGAGTGGTTETVLQDLVLPDGRQMYASYTYTDISAGFFVGAKERFKNVQNMKYAVLDITKDPIEQGFEAQGYDLVLASNVTTNTFFSTVRH
jgi:acyl transferase domain-containing protein